MEHPFLNINQSNLENKKMSYSGSCLCGDCPVQSKYEYSGHVSLSLQFMSKTKWYGHECSNFSSSAIFWMDLRIDLNFLLSKRDWILFSFLSTLWLASTKSGRYNCIDLDSFGTFRSSTQNSAQIEFLSELKGGLGRWNQGGWVLFWTARIWKINLLFWSFNSVLN